MTTFSNTHSKLLGHCNIDLIYRGYYTVARKYEFYFRVAKQYFTNERSEWVKYCFCHEKIKFISSSRRVMFFLLYRYADDGVFDDFPKISKDFPKLFRIPDERSRKFPKTSEEDPKMFRWYTNEFKYNVRDKPDVIERYDTHKGGIRKIRHSGPGWSGVWNLRVV